MKVKEGRESEVIKVLERAEGRLEDMSAGWDEDLQTHLWCEAEMGDGDRHRRRSRVKYMGGSCRGIRPVFVCLFRSECKHKSLFLNAACFCRSLFCVVVRPTHRLLSDRHNFCLSVLKFYEFLPQSSLSTQQRNLRRLGCPTPSLLRVKIYILRTRHPAIRSALPPYPHSSISIRSVCSIKYRRQLCLHSAEEKFAPYQLPKSLVCTRSSLLRPSNVKSHYADRQVKENEPAADMIYLKSDTLTFVLSNLTQLMWLIIDFITSSLYFAAQLSYLGLLDAVVRGTFMRESLYETVDIFQVHAQLHTAM